MSRPQGHFLYFVEGDESRCGLTPEQSEALAPVLGDVGAMQIPLRSPDHPSGKFGVLVRPGVDRFPVERFAFDPKAQEWRRWNASGVWVGMWIDWQPGPQTLRRPKPFPGIDAELEDGRIWTLPRLMFYTSRPEVAGMTALPTAVEWSVDGTPEERPLRKYRELSLAGEELWRHATNFKAVESTQAMCEATLRIAPKALNLNYRVTEAECSLLQLFSTRNLIPVAFTLCDCEGFRLLTEQKKNESSGASLPSG